MSISKTINGITVTLPELSDSSWGSYTTSLLEALVDASIFTGSGSTKPLTATLNLGATYGVVTAYISSAASNPGSTGVVRLSNGDKVSWRNAGNTDEVEVWVDGSNRLVVDGAVIATGPATSIDNEIARFDGVTGAIQGYSSTGPTISDTGVITVANTTSSTTKDTGAIIVEGGVGIEENLNIGGVLKVASTTSSTTKDTGAVIIEGGVGVEENVSVGGAVKTNTISELTSAAGVTIDGLKIKDSALVTPLIASDVPAIPAEGHMWWNSTDKAMNIYAGTGTTLQVGQENYIYVRNQTGSQINNGQVVYIYDANTQRARVALAQANSATTSDRVIGLATQDIANDAYGMITTFGLVRDLVLNKDDETPQNSISDGDILYLSATVAGGKTTVAPTAPNHRIILGTVIDAHATAGIFLVGVDKGNHLTHLHDVKISGVADNNLLQYTSSTTTWDNVTPDTVGGDITNTVITGKTLTGYTSGAGTVASSDTILQAINKLNGNNQLIVEAQIDLKEPTGFVDPANIDVAYDSTTRKFTLTHSSGTIEYYTQGTLRTLSSPWTNSTAHTNTTGHKYWLYLDNSGTETWTTDSFPGFDKVLVAAVDFGATDKIGLKECHGLQQWQCHQNDHYTTGTYRISGGTVEAASWTANTYTTVAVTPATEACVIADEDLTTTIAALTDGSTYTRLHFDTGVAVFSTASTLPFPNDGTDPQYNQNPISGTALTSISTNGRYFNVYGIYVPVTSEAASQAYRILWMTGQQIYTTVAAAQGEDFRSLQLGNLNTVFPEFCPFIRLTYGRQVAGGSATTFNTFMPTSAVSYLVGSKQNLTSVTGFTPTDHNTLTGRSDADSHPASAITNTPAGNITAVTVQAAIDELDGDKVAGPAASTDNAIMRFDGIAGKTAQDYTATAPTIDDNGIVTINNATDASDKDTGAVIVEGGVGVEKKLYVGTEIHAGTSVNTATVNATASIVLQDPGAGTNTVTLQAPTLVGDLTVKLPATAGSSGLYLKTDGSGNTSWDSPAGAGDVIGPATSVDNSIARFNGTDNKTIQDSLVTISDDSPTAVTVTSADAGAGAGPDLVLYRNSASAADSDAIGRVIFRGNDDDGAPAANDYASIETAIIDSGAGSEDGTLTIKACRAGSAVSIASFSSSGGFNNLDKHEVIMTPATGRGSALNSTVRTFTAATTGTALTFTADATNGDYVTVNVTGIYTIIYYDKYSGGTSYSGISRNATGSDLTNNVTDAWFQDSPGTKKLAISYQGEVEATWTGHLTAADVIRFQDNKQNDATTRAYAKITKIG